MAWIRSKANTEDSLVVHRARGNCTVPSVDSWTERTGFQCYSLNRTENCRFFVSLQLHPIESLFRRLKINGKIFGLNSKFSYSNKIRDIIFLNYHRQNILRLKKIFVDQISLIYDSLRIVLLERWELLEASNVSCCTPRSEFDRVGRRNCEQQKGTGCADALLDRKRQRNKNKQPWRINGCSSRPRNLAPATKLATCTTCRQSHRDISFSPRRRPLLLFLLPSVLLLSAPSIFKRHSIVRPQPLRARADEKLFNCFIVERVALTFGQKHRRYFYHKKYYRYQVSSLRFWTIDLSRKDSEMSESSNNRAVRFVSRSNLHNNFPL